MGSPGSPITDIEWSKEGLWKFPPPSLSPPTPTLANLDYLLGQKPGFLSGPPLPILEIGESMGCPGPFPKPSVRVDLNITSAIMCVTLPSATGTGECTLFWGGGEAGKPPSSFLAASGAQFHRLLSSPESHHRHTKATRQSQPYTGTIPCGSEEEWPWQGAVPTSSCRIPLWRLRMRLV